uniref:Helicase ATP-binding domain-containing protein n=1 Tax=Fagus sylvatica TaxID=28930 RepID=A0A2N9HDI2_FAGSY
MTSIIDEDDDDGFDWEAAVKEIDVACHAATATATATTKPSSSTSHFAPPETPKFPSSSNTNKHSRQSTLHNFISKAAPPRPQYQAPNLVKINQDHFDGGYGISCIDIDSEAAKTWIYPVNVPHRDYQFAITKKALFSNTLVALPTGLGKTLIAAVVMYNYFRWFPDGKIVFAAPSRPLVMQQIEACHNIVGIPQEWTIDMTGQISPTKRAGFWKTKRVFFVTPQVLEKDIQSGTCLVKYLVCLVIDEAHRAMGNFSYCVAVRELMAVPVQLRILALTATPGSKQQTIQQVIDNLCISTLEYRNESDNDVSPYVHNRKIELIQVAMGQDAVEVNNKLSEVVRPIVARLCAIGVLNRDYQTLSPCELLNLRDKFRQAPPSDLPHIKYNEVEGYFGVLITLSHIRKLLSSHGIRPAYEMLEEKLQQGSFARFMSKNEDIRKSKLLMQQNLSHGAPSPKLSKMLEVLLDHFNVTTINVVAETKDPQSSRVIIFSNFRGSVRDIMEALANIGDIVRATQFIGQSSGKSLKGQSQKVQQAVLEKFRAGGFNVIVATSIGEEGLDIMEVDLVICFDANVSPLRMIQRMGRTGRKHDGRVDIHFIPHIYKPEVQFAELSIEQFVPRGKKVKDDRATPTSAFQDKLTVAETGLIAKYFHSTGDNTWRPSLIAFPHFQTFPSRVHKVMHANRTGMLIDMMQRLQGLSFSGDSEAIVVEDEAILGKSLVVNAAEQHDPETKGLLVFVDSPNKKSQREVSEVSPREILKTQEKHSVPDFCGQDPPAHSYLFGSDYVSVDAFGKVSILSVPLLPFKEDATSAKSPNSLKQDSCHLRTSTEENKEPTMQATAIGEITSPTRCINDETLPISRLCDSDVQQEKTLDGIENIPETPILKGNLSNEGDGGETPDVAEIKAPLFVDDECGNDFIDIELSPRLTNLIKSGVVPESPINDRGLSDGKKTNEFLVLDLVSPAQLRTALILKSPSPERNGTVIKDISNDGRNSSISPINNVVQTPVPKLKNKVHMRGCTSTSPGVVEAQTPFTNLTNSSCSKDWHLSSGDKSESIEQRRKFKRLRKVGDCGKGRNLKGMKENSVVPIANLARSFSSTSPFRNKHVRGKKNKDARDFIEEEAEVSSDADISDDEEDEQDNNSNDSFIDDRINSTAASTQAESCRVDMMAIYRRSLLSQSPMHRLPNCSATLSPDSLAPMARISGSGSGSPQANPCTLSRLLQLNLQIEYVPPINLEPEFLLQSDTAGRDSFQHHDANGDANEDAFDDDQFYEGLDLDAMEAQATLLFKQKSELSIKKQEIIPQLSAQNPSLLSSPSFDLGLVDDHVALLGTTLPMLPPFRRVAHIVI